MTCGIYKLNFIGTPKVYIGKSINIEGRLNSHIAAIKSNKGAKKLSEAFHTYGLPTIEVLLECSKEELNSAETEAILIYNSVANGFNTLSLSDEVPDVDNSGDLNGMSKISNDKAIEIFKYLVNNKYAKLHEVSKIFEVSYNIVNAMASCTNHRWLKEAYPEDYALLESYKGRSNGKSAADRGIIYPPIISPDNNIYVVSNIRTFSQEHGLDRGSLNKLLNNKVKSHKGWKLA